MWTFADSLESLESLESRTLFNGGFPFPINWPPPWHGFTAAAGVSGIQLRDGVLLVNGTHKDDRITVTRMDGAPELLANPGEFGTLGNGFRLVTSGADTAVIPVAQPAIDPSVPASTLVISVRGHTYFADARSIDEIRLEGGAGNDTLRVDQNVGIHADLRGGVGNDTVEAGQSRDFLRGGSGDDELITPKIGPLSRYQGNAGQDIITTKFDPAPNFPPGPFSLPDGIEGVRYLSHD